MNVAVSAELLVEFRKVGGHARAELGERAARVNEGDQQNLPVILAEGNSAAVLIGEREVGDDVAGGGNMLGGRGWRNPRARGDLDVLKPGVGVVGAVSRWDDDQGGANGLAGGELA